MVFRNFCFFCFSHFRTLIEKALDGLAILSIRLSKLHITCPAEHFEGKNPFLKKTLNFFTSKR